ncbi:MAG: signal peptidase I, partial [Silvibacterium sp.]
VLPTPVPPAVHQRAAIHIVYPSLLETISSLLSILVVAMFLLTFLVQPFRIPSESMERTLLVGDFLLVNKSIYGPPGHFSWLLPYRPVQDGDIVVFHFPLNPPEHVVKRVIGAPGDRIHLKNGIVYRNGQPLNEPYTVNEPAYPDSFRDNFPAKTFTDPDVDIHWWQQMRHNEDGSGGDLIVPAGEYFVMGDNRNHSRDSRYWGFVPRSAIVGRPFIIYFSLRRPSATDVPELPGNAILTPQDDKLDHEGTLDKIVDFARWNRILRIVR